MKIRARQLAFLCCSLVLASAGSESAQAKHSNALPAPRGILREGIWKLDEAKSVQLAPGAQTLWVIKDNSKVLIWVNILTNPEGMVRTASFEGHYGGEPSPVLGTPMTAQLDPAKPGYVATSGSIEGLGPFREECEISMGNRHFVCHGKVTTAEGEKTWLDVFNWTSPSP